jgi:hypothetical protein
MYLILVKEDGAHTLHAMAQSLAEVKEIVNGKELQDKIDNGKAYLIEGTIRLIRPETTPELLDVKEVSKKKDIYY